jgi:predicted RNA-binding protein YlxR (DUF448 family)
MTAPAHEGKHKTGRRAVRHVPERMCVACRTRRPQRHLVSLVRSPAGVVEIDRTGKKPGRGAYLCPAQECWRLARTRGSLEQALKVPIPAEQWQEFEAYMLGLPETLR